ncbi:S8 family serine peptidase [Nonomuraea sp. NPDC003707]
MRFTIRERAGHLIVIPSDAAPLIARGVLDERLFGVTGLLSSRYGDADRPDIPIIRDRRGQRPRARHRELAGQRGRGAHRGGRWGVTTDFSSRGPRSFDHAVKPDISAPGTDIVAAQLGGGYVAHKGTSMAAPHVAGRPEARARDAAIPARGRGLRAALAFEMPFHALGYVARASF